MLRQNSSFQESQELLFFYCCWGELALVDTPTSAKYKQIITASKDSQWRASALERIIFQAKSNVRPVDRKIYLAKNISKGP